ncbi:hypothetical protein CIB54_03100 [Pseudomonas fluorescens]|uniref:Uncharacterized protein n=1 Tax=Pseudomonas fluorescens TaxID=294 RepID=A0A2N1EEM0_PSEFL|nr:hypothetical protein CIB54_03100 [Pseudomonas fluorescens]
MWVMCLQVKDQQRRALMVRGTDAPLVTCRVQKAVVQHRRQPRIEAPKHFVYWRSAGRVFKAWSGRAQALASGLQMDWQSIR